MNYWKRFLYSALALTLIVGMPCGCRNTTSDDSNSQSPSDDNKTLTGQAKGFTPLKEETRAFYADIEKGTLTVPKTHYANEDKFIATANVAQYGAVGDGVTDDYEAFRQAIKAAEPTGGTVFVPAGVYYVSNCLQLPQGVILRGEYDSPEVSGYGGGTTIITDYAKTGMFELPFVALSSCSGVRNMAFYYLNQSFTDPLDLAPCIGFGASAAGTTLENVMIYNASYPLYMGGFGNSAHMYKNVWATPLKQGLLSDRNGDVFSFVNIHMDAKYYAECGFYGAPQNDADREKLYATLQNAVSFIFERHDTPFTSRLYSHDIGTAMIVRESSHPDRQVWENGGGFGGGVSVYEFEFTGCHTGVQIEKIHVSTGFVKGRIETNDSPDAVAIRATDKLRTDATFTGVEFAGKPRYVVHNNAANGNIQLSNCTFADWQECGVKAESAYTYLVNCSFSKADNAIAAEYARGIGVSGCTFVGTPQISTVGMDENNVLVYNQELPNLLGAPTISYDFAETKNTAYKYEIYNAADYGPGLDLFGEDDASVAINAALKEAGDNGGGIVYVPPGQYRLDKTLYVPEGVELRGALDSYHANIWLPAGRDTLFYVYGGAGQTEGDGAVVLAKNSGVMGMSFYYPEQNVDGYKEGQEYTPYPFTITAKGPNCWSRFVVCANSYQMADFGSAPDVSNYEIIGMRGQPLKVGIFGGNNSGTGRVENCNFSLAEWCYGGLPYKPSFGSGTYDYEGMKTNENWKNYVMNLLANSDYYKFGYNKNLLVYSNLAYSARYGLRFVEQNGKYTENAKLFYHNTDLCSSTVKIEKAGTLEFYTSFADCEMDANCGATVNSYATGMNTVFEQCMQVHGGTLNLGGLFVFRKYKTFLTVTGGEVNISYGMLVDTSEVLVKASGGKVTVSGLVMRNRRGTVKDDQLIPVEQTGDAVVSINGCMGTAAGLPWE